MKEKRWNHNIHYHPVILRAIPDNCRRAIDVGCGQGFLAADLVQKCQEVVALDTDRDAIQSAQERLKSNRRIKFVMNDVMTHPFQKGDFDLITLVATLHHLPLESALVRFRDLLRPGGVLVVVGLYRASTVLDFAIAAIAFPTSWALGFIRGRTEVGAPIQDPRETLSEIKSAFESVLPSTAFRRNLLFRYTAIWRKPDG